MVKIYRGGKSLYEGICGFSESASPKFVLILVVAHGLVSRFKFVGNAHCALASRVYSSADNFAVTSISIFIFSSSKPASNIVAAGRTEPRCF